MPIGKSHKITLVLVSGGKANNGSALNPFGPLKAGLTQRQVIHDPQLEVLLSTLEKHLATLESKFCAEIATFLSDTAYLAEPYATKDDGTGTKC